MSKEEILTVSFCREDNGEAGIMVFKELENDGNQINTCALKMEIGERAEILYRLLTDPEEIVFEMRSNNQKLKKNISLKPSQTVKHTCGRCKHEHKLEYEYPCIACIYGTDTRQDLWEEKEDEYWN